MRFEIEKITIDPEPLYDYMTDDQRDFLADRKIVKVYANSERGRFYVVIRAVSNELLNDEIAKNALFNSECEKFLRTH